MACIIAAYERRDIANIDVPGAFLQTKMQEFEKDIHVVLEEHMTELLAQISPEIYQKYVHHRRFAMYVTLKAALLFWIKLTLSQDEGICNQSL